MKRAKDVMDKKPNTIKDSDSVQAACKVLIRRKISGAPVIDKNGKLIGFISEKDIIKFLSRSKPANKKVSLIMKKRVKSVDENTSLDLISKIFSEKLYRLLPVTAGTMLVGVINRSKIMDNLLSEHY